MKDSKFFKPAPELRKLFILQKIYSHEEKSQNQIADELGYAVSSVNGFFKELRDQGLIKKIEKGYTVTEAGKKELNNLSKELSEEIESLRESSPKFPLEGSSAPDIEKVTVGIIKALGTTIPLVAQEDNLFEESELKVDIRLYDNGYELMGDFADREMDFACLGLSNFLRNKSQNQDIAILAGCNYGGHSIVVKKDRDIGSLSGLEGKTLLVTPEGTVSRGLLELLIEREDGLENVIAESGITPSNMPYALEFNDKIDGILTWEPYPTQAVGEFDDLKVLVDLERHWEEQIGKSYLTNVLIHRAGIDKRWKNRFLSIHEKTIQSLNNNTGPYLEFLSRFFTLPESVIQEAMSKVQFKSSLRWRGF